MAIRPQQFVDDFTSFCRASLEWCAAESLAATTRIAETITPIVANAERVANKSPATRQALADTRKRIDAFTRGETRELHTLLIAMHKAVREDQDASDLLMPLVAALQFQDRLQQYLLAIAKMLELWASYRTTIGAIDALTDDLKRDFAKKLMEKTVSIEERDVIRRHFAGLGLAEEKAGDTGLF